MRDFKDIKVAVAGTGYVGLSIATLLSQHHHVATVDIVPVLSYAYRTSMNLTQFHGMYQS